MARLGLPPGAAVLPVGEGGPYIWRMNRPDDPETIGGDGPLVVIPDANVLVHGKALPDLPWTELGRGSIELLFVPPVIRELDQLKNQTGRPNKIARQLSSDVRALMAAPGRRAEIRRSQPILTKRVELRAITTSLHDALKLDHSDQALINYALHLRDDGLDVLLLTDDTICAATALEVGLHTMMLPDHWLREPEADEAAKENARLRAENKRLAAAEPRVSLEFRDVEGAKIDRLNVSVTRWPALSEEEIDTLMDDVGRLCPPATSFEPLKPRATNELLRQLASNKFTHLAAFQPREVHEPASEEEIDAYKTGAYPDWLESVREMLHDLPDRLEARTEWPSLSAVAANRGTRPATDTLLTIAAKGDFEILDADANRAEDDDEDTGTDSRREPLTLPLPPEPPRGRTRKVDGFGRSLAFTDQIIGVARARPIDLPTLSMPRPREPDSFYWRTGRNGWVAQIQLECAVWRHGQEEVATLLKIRPEELTRTSGAIELAVHATNLSDPPRILLPVRIEIEDGCTLGEAKRLVERLGRAAAAHGRV